jgi:hypothetical protein
VVEVVAGGLVGAGPVEVTGCGRHT